MVPWKWYQFCLQKHSQCLKTTDLADMIDQIHISIASSFFCIASLLSYNMSHICFSFQHIIQLLCTTEVVSDFWSRYVSENYNSHWAAWKQTRSAQRNTEISDFLSDSSFGVPSFSVHFLASVIKHPAYEMIEFRVSFEISMLYSSRIKFLCSTMQLIPQIIESKFSSA